MERYSLFLDWKIQIVENDYTIQSNLQTQCNPFLIANGIFQRTKNFTVCVETQNTLTSQSNLEKEKWNQGNRSFWLQTILKSYSHHNSTVMAQKYGPIELNKKLRDNPIQLRSPNLTVESRIYSGEKTSSLVSGTGKTGRLHVKK